MTSGLTPRPIHVERTTDPAVLRWVVHHPALDASPPGRRQIPGHSSLGELVADGSIISIAVRHDSVLATASDPGSWPQLAPQVQSALLDELDRLDQAGFHWLLEAVDTDHGRPASIDEVQAVVDRAAGTVMASHGGAMTVTAIDDGTVALHSTGACTGCRQSDDTIVGLIVPALSEAFPEFTSVVVDDDRQEPSQRTAHDRPPEPAHERPARVSLRGRVRRQRNISCH